jgi:hypothetical protein
MTLFGLFTLSLMFAGSAGAAVSKNQAGLEALRVLRPQDAGRPVVVFGIRHPISGDVADAGPDRSQPIRYVRGTHGGESVVTARGSRLRRRAWLFWEDLVPYTEFAHPSVLLLIDARNGHVLRHQRYEFWPVVNGRKPPFLQGNGYNNGRYRLFDNARPPEPAADPPAHSSQAAAQLPNDCLVQQFDGTDNSFIGDAKAWTQFANDSGFKVTYTTNTLVGMKNALVDAGKRGCTDALIYLGGHGFAATGANLPIGNEKAAESQFGQLITKWRARGTEIFTDTVSAAGLADTLANARSELAKSGKPMDYKIIVQSCFAGRFLQYTRLDALAKFIGGAAGTSEGASGNDNRNKDGWYYCPDPSYYSNNLIKRLRSTPPGTLPDRLIQAAKGLPKGPNGEEPVYWDGKEVQGGGASGKKGGGGTQGVTADACSLSPQPCFVEIEVTGDVPGDTNPNPGFGIVTVTPRFDGCEQCTFGEEGGLVGVFGSNSGGQSGYSLDVIANFAAPTGVLASHDRPR